MIPWIGLPLLVWLLYRTTRRERIRADCASKLSATSRQAIEVKRQAGLVFAVFGLLGIGLYIFNLPVQYWLFPALISTVAFLIFCHREVVIQKEENGL